MARRRYLVAYDIRDQKRLQAVAACMKGYGDRIQYSVFLCDLTERELILMRGDLEARMNLQVDSAMTIDLGDPHDSSRIVLIGQRPAMPQKGASVI